MSSKEPHHAGQPGRMKQGLGLAKLAAVEKSRGGAGLEHVDARVDPKQRALEKHISKGGA